MKVEAISQLTELHIQDLFELYQSTWWAKERTVEGIRKMLNHTDLIIGLCDEGQKLVGFARVITDYVYRAVLWDVIVAQSYQRQGLGKMLINEIINHPSLQDVETIYLTCLPEMVSYYEQFDFRDDLRHIRLMQRRSDWKD